MRWRPSPRSPRFAPGTSRRRTSPRRRSASAKGCGTPRAVESLLTQLAGIRYRRRERPEVEVELRAERDHSATLRSRLTDLHRRANLAHVSLRIETGASSTGGAGGGGRGIGDGLDDAGRILAIAAGVAVIGLAILVPLAAIGLLGWLAHRVWLRRARARALA